VDLQGDMELSQAAAELGGEMQPDTQEPIAGRSESRSLQARSRGSIGSSQGRERGAGRPRKSEVVSRAAHAQASALSQGSKECTEMLAKAISDSTREQTAQMERESEKNREAFLQAISMLCSAISQRAFGNSQSQNDTEK